MVLTQRIWEEPSVDIQDWPSIPTEAQKNDYTYDPIPAECSPRIMPNILMHLFEHPDHAECEPVLYRNIAKKLRQKLEACPVKKSAVGWGVHFVEGLNWFNMFIYVCSDFVAALVLIVAWSIVRQYIQGGFAITGFMLAFLGFCLGLARTEV